MKKKKNKALVIHGPNLHLLGKRETKIYGKMTLTQINKAIEKEARALGLEVEVYQSNSEGDIVEKITGGIFDFLILNPAAYTHTSVAIRDAILATKKTVIEVHISNIFTREDFRKKSLISDVVKGVITGFGMNSYLLALRAIKTSSSFK